MFTCIVCKKEYPLTAEYFHRDRTKTTGFHPYCKACRSTRKTPALSVTERFWTRVVKGEPNECWVWIGGKYLNGYGTYRNTGAHRYSYKIHFGKIPKGMNVLHKCDNPPCVNPSHLFLGTQKDNMADKVEKGRQHKGEGHYASKVTKEQVREIRRLAKTGLNYSQISETFPISADAVGMIVRRKNWKHVK